MSDIPSPSKIMNHHLYELREKDMQERNQTKEELLSAINGVSTDVAVLQTEIKNHNKRVDTIETDLKKRDNYGYVGTIIAGLIAGISFWDK